MSLNLSLQEVFVFVVVLLHTLSSSCFSCPIHRSSGRSNFSGRHFTHKKIEFNLFGKSSKLTEHTYQNKIKSNIFGYYTPNHPTVKKILHQCKLHIIQREKNESNKESLLTRLTSSKIHMITTGHAFVFIMQCYCNLDCHWKRNIRQYLLRME